MNVLYIAWRSILQRGVASALTSFSMALGVMLVVIVISLHGLVAESFSANSSVGYNMIIGARGGSMQLALNSVYYLSKPLETIPYEYYLAFQPQEMRAEEIKDSVAYRADQASWNAMQIQSAALPMPGMGIVNSYAQDAAVELMQSAEQAKLGMLEDGMFAGSAEFVVPICLGDYFGEYRVIATTPAFVNDIETNARTKKKLELSEGRNFETFNEDHGYFECVVGSTVAKRMGVKIGDRINPSHGAPDGKEHDDGFAVVGIIAESRTPNDRAVFVNVEGFYLMDDHAKPINETLDGAAAVDPLGLGEFGFDMEAGDQESEETPEEEHDEAAPADYSSVIFQERLPLEQREITALLVKTSAGIKKEVLEQADEEERAFLMLASTRTAMDLETQINEGRLEETLDWSPFRPNLQQKSSQSISPVAEIRTLLDVFVAPIQLVLLLLTCMIVVVAGLSILVSIYNSMNERKSEIAVMRALGARRNTVMSIILLETLILSLAGGLTGWVAAHGINVVISPYVEYHTGVSIGFFDLAPPAAILGFANIDWQISPELALIPGLMLLATIVGLYPSLAAYRTDVAKALSA